MTLVRTEEQEILAHTARELVNGRSPLRRVREDKVDVVHGGITSASREN